MPTDDQRFRDFGLAPVNLTPPAGPVRAYFPWYHVFGQFAGTGCVTFLGLGLAALMLLTIPRPINFLVPILPLAGAAVVIYLVTRHDSAWVELDGATLRAKHLYTRRVVTRRVEEVKELFTHVLSGVNLSAALVNAWLGRVRAVEVRFNDGTTPMKICRTDPSMVNAPELIEAILYRMSQIGEVDYDIVLLDGKPLVQRVFWGKDKLEVGPLLRDEWARRRPPTEPPGERSTGISPHDTPPPSGHTDRPSPSRGET